MRINGITDINQLLEARELLRAATATIGKAAAADVLAQTGQSIELFTPIHISPQARARLAIHALSGLSPEQLTQTFADLVAKGSMESLFRFHADDPEFLALFETVARSLRPIHQSTVGGILASINETIESEAFPAQQKSDAKVPESQDEIGKLARILSRQLTRLKAEGGPTLSRSDVLQALPLQQAGKLAQVLFGGDFKPDPPSTPQPGTPLTPSKSESLQAATARALAESISGPGTKQNPELMAKLNTRIADVAEAHEALFAASRLTSKADPIPVLRELGTSLTPHITPGGRGELVRFLRWLDAPSGISARPGSVLPQPGEPAVFQIEVRRNPDMEAVVERLRKQGLQVVLEPLPQDGENKSPLMRVTIMVAGKSNKPAHAEFAKSSNAEKDAVAAAQPQRLNGESIKPSRHENAHARMPRPGAEGVLAESAAMTEMKRDSPLDRLATSNERREAAPADVPREPRIERNDFIAPPVGQPIKQAPAKSRKSVESHGEAVDARPARDEYIPIPREKALLPRPPAPCPARIADIKFSWAFVESRLVEVPATAALPQPRVS